MWPVKCFRLFVVPSDSKAVLLPLCLVSYDIRPHSIIVQYDHERRKSSVEAPDVVSRSAGKDEDG